jgi:hypothetical protein
MGRIHDAEGRGLGLWVDDIENYSIATADFSPLEGSLTDTEQQKYIRRGFAVRGDVDGTIYVITWREWKHNREVLADCTPVPLYALGGLFETVPVIKVFASNDQTYATTPTNINVGIIL